MEYKVHLHCVSLIVHNTLVFHADINPKRMRKSLRQNRFSLYSDEYVDESDL